MVPHWKYHLHKRIRKNDTLSLDDCCEEVILQERITQLKQKMSRLYVERADLLDPSILEVSQRLDVFLVKLQKMIGFHPTPGT
jgi:hypothetical protein